jgi:hypothetical protein
MFRLSIGSGCTWSHQRKGINIVMCHQSLSCTSATPYPWSALFQHLLGFFSFAPSHPMSFLFRHHPPMVYLNANLLLSLLHPSYETVKPRPLTFDVNSIPYVVKLIPFDVSHFVMHHGSVCLVFRSSGAQGKKKRFFSFVTKKQSHKQSSMTCTA